MAYEVWISTHCLYWLYARCAYFSFYFISSSASLAFCEPHSFLCWKVYVFRWFLLKDPIVLIRFHTHTNINWRNIYANFSFAKPTKIKCTQHNRDYQHMHGIKFCSQTHTHTQATKSWVWVVFLLLLVFDLYSIRANYQNTTALVSLVTATPTVSICTICHIEPPCTATNLYLHFFLSTLFHRMSNLKWIFR